MVQANAGVVQIDINDYVQKDDSGEEVIGSQAQSRKSERIDGNAPKLAEAERKAQHHTEAHS